MKISRVFSTGFLFCAALAVTACAPEAVKPGIIAPEVRLERAADAPGVYIHAPFRDISAYPRMVIEPVELIRSGAAPDPEKAQRLTDHCRRELVARMANDYEVVDHGGAGVLRLRAAILYAQTRPGYDLSKSVLEIVVTDSLTDRHILALADTRPHHDAGQSLFSDWENAKGVMQAWGGLIHGKIAALKNP